MPGCSFGLRTQLNIVGSAARRLGARRVHRPYVLKENVIYHFDSIGERAGTRTQDHLIKSQVLYQLSYALAGGVCKGASEAGQ